MEVMRACFRTTNVLTFNFDNCRGCAMLVVVFSLMVVLWMLYRCVSVPEMC